jgi:hypothetical protein
MKAIKSLLIIVMLFIGTISFAQSHNTATGSNCKYAKNRCTNMEGCPQCAACNTDDKKEKEAKVAEVKKRNDKIWADAKIKKDAEQKAYRDKLAADEVKRKAESGNVVINGQSENKIKKVVSEKKTIIAKNNGSGRYLSINANGSFMDAITKENLPYNNSLKYRSIQSVIIDQDSISRNKFPKNTAVVILEEEVSQENNKNYYSGGTPSTYYVSDLVDENQQRLLNSNSICHIEHFYGDWFLIGYNFINGKLGIGLDFETAKLYNRKTKVYIEIIEKSYNDLVPIWMIRGHGRERIVNDNYHYMKGLYDKYYLDYGGKIREYDRSDADLLLDSKLGGTDKWKAFLSVHPVRSKSDRSNDVIIYYLDISDKIQKLTISKDDSWKLR